MHDTSYLLVEVRDLIDAHQTGNISKKEKPTNRLHSRVELPHIGNLLFHEHNSMELVIGKINCHDGC